MNKQIRYFSSHNGWYFGRRLIQNDFIAASRSQLPAAELPVDSMPLNRKENFPNRAVWYSFTVELIGAKIEKGDLLSTYLVGKEKKKENKGKERKEETAHI